MLALTLDPAAHLVAAAPHNFDDMQMDALRKAVNDAYTGYWSAKDSDGTLWKKLIELEETNLPQMFALAEKKPASKEAFEAFLWIAIKSTYNQGPLFTNRLQSLEFLAKYHATNPAVGPLCSYLGHFWEWRWRDKPVVDFLQAVAKNNPDPANRGQALFGLGRIYVSKSEYLAELKNWGAAPFFTNGPTMDVRAELVKYGSSQSAADEAEHLLKEVIANYAGCRDLREQPGLKREAPLLKDEAKQELFELLHLSPGKTAPEIKAKSVQGRQCKLSDSRGKITVLNFWASWCGPCMQLVPVERALNARMKARPFAIVGVNGDPILADARRAIRTEKMTWPSFWNGKGGPRGPISSAWNVHGWPTVYVLDANGVIRFKLMGYGPQTSNVLNGCVDELMRQLSDRRNLSLHN